MQIEDAIKVIDGVAKLLGVLAWPAVAMVTLALFRATLHDFISSLSEVRVRGGGFEASAQRRLNLDATSRKLYDFWKPEGRVSRANATRITACMEQLSIAGSVGSLINAGTAEDRAKVAACLSL